MDKHKPETSAANDGRCSIILTQQSLNSPSFRRRAQRKRRNLLFPRPPRLYSAFTFRTDPISNPTDNAAIEKITARELKQRMHHTVKTYFSI